MISGPSLSSAACFAILAAILLYLYWQNREELFRMWGLAWLVLFGRQLAVALTGGPVLPWLWPDVVLLAAASALLLLGAFAYAGPARLGPFRAALIGLALGVLSVLAFLALLEIDPQPNRAWAAALGFLGATSILSAWLIGRYGREAAPIGSDLTGAALIAWGVLLPIGWTIASGSRGGGAGWLPVLEAVLGALITIGMIILGIEASRSQLVTRRVDARNLFDEDPNMILVIQDGQYVFVNRAFRERFGWGLDDIQGDGLFERVAPEYREQASARYSARLREEPVTDYELEFLDARGERVPVIVHADGIQWDAGKALKYELMDITTRRQAEAEIRAINVKLQRINTELEKSNQLKTEFLSNTSHELKTPLTSIIANTEILEYEMCGPVNDEQRRVLANISRNSQHLLDMISRLLDFARHEEGHPLLRYERVDLRALLDGVVETVGPLLEDGTRRIVVIVDERLEPCYLDGEKVYRVYLNLVENAIKFSRTGEIRVEAERVEDEIEGRVVDQGIGIPAEKLEEIFEAFRQVDASTTRAYQGVGLGLAICKQLIELHGGRIWAESAPDEGTTMHFRVPYRPDPPDSVARPTADAAMKNLS